MADMSGSGSAGLFALMLLADARRPTPDARRPTPGVRRSAFGV
ncbi:hypothetical protein [Microbispora hainanensis]